MDADEDLEEQTAGTAEADVDALAARCADALGTLPRAAALPLAKIRARAASALAVIPPDLRAAEADAVSQALLEDAESIAAVLPQLAALAGGGLAGTATALRAARQDPRILRAGGLQRATKAVDALAAAAGRAEVEAALAGGAHGLLSVRADATAAPGVLGAIAAAFHGDLSEALGSPGGAALLGRKPEDLPPHGLSLLARALGGGEAALGHLADAPTGLLLAVNGTLNTTEDRPPPACPATTSARDAMPPTARPTVAEALAGAAARWGALEEACGGAAVALAAAAECPALLTGGGEPGAPAAAIAWLASELRGGRDDALRVVRRHPAVLGGSLGAMKRAVEEAAEIFGTREAAWERLERQPRYLLASAAEMQTWLFSISPCMLNIKGSWPKQTAIEEYAKKT